MKFPEIHIHVHIHENEDHENQRQRVRQLQSLSRRLSQSNDKLTTALEAYILRPVTHNPISTEKNKMTIDEVIADLTAKVEAGETVQDSAVTYIKGVPAMVQAAVDKYIADHPGLTAEQEAALGAISTKISDQTAETLAALTANTPEDPNP